MKKNLCIAAIVLLAMAVSFGSCNCRKKEACKDEKTSCSVVKADSLLGLFVNAWNSGKTETLKGMIAPDAVILSKDWKAEGIDSVMVKWILKEVPNDHNLATTPIKTCTCCCCISYTGYYTIDITEKKGIRKETGNFTFIWKKQEDKSWKLEVMHIAEF